MNALGKQVFHCWQGARDLSKPPTLTEILQCTLERAKNEQQPPPEEEEEEDEETKEENKEGKKGYKRKFDTRECSDQDQGDDSQKGNMKSSKEMENLNKAKNVGIHQI